MPTNRKEYMRLYRREYCKRKPEVCRKATMKWRGLQHDLVFKVSEAEMRASITSCEICGITPGEKDKSLALDHCHKTGHVRGLLCLPCNIAIGNLKDDVALMQKAIEYLQRFVSLAPEAISFLP